MTVEELQNLSFKGCDLSLRWGDGQLSIVPAGAEASHTIPALSFEAVSNPWVLLWEDHAQRWSDRLELLPQDRCRASGFDAKAAHDKIKISFACEHPGGLLRWGFTTLGVARRA